MQFLSLLWHFLTGLWSSLLAFAGQNLILVLIDLVLTSLTLYPLIDFFFVGWRHRASEIATSLNPKAKQLYLSTFQQQQVTPAQAPHAFDKLYRDWYGRRYHFIPILLVLLVTIVEGFVLAQALQDLKSGGAKTFTT